AMGHGVPASLLTIFLKKAVRTKEINGSLYRLIPPDEVLQRLNRDLVEQGVAESPFITMSYALYNFEDCVLRLARAGHPHPLYLPAAGEPEFWKIGGSLLGVFETEFTTREYQLHPGDKVLFYTDGADVATAGDQSGTELVLACARRHRES